MSSSYGLDTYRVGIFVGSGVPTAPSDFTIISGASNLQAPFPNWGEYTANLDNYLNQTVRIAIHCNSVDRYFFLVDDFKVTTATLSSEDFFKSNFSMYPNPVKDVLNISANQTITSVEIMDLNGRVVSVWNGDLQNVQLNTSSLQSGLYVLSVTSEAGKGTSKFIKQ